ncbi:hypothetical protein CPB85DRAFT_1257785 [Mucidula mucida]|nr:hypothetical protein CPB85DRAFT_1257785 [Mucidula mucida]
MVVIGFVMIAIVLVPAWRSSEIYRLKTWFALMIAGLFYSVSYFLTVGRQFGEEPAFGLCLLQAALIYGAPVLTSSLSLSFTVEVNFASSPVFRALLIIVWIACELLAMGGVASRRNGLIPCLVHRDTSHLLLYGIVRSLRVFADPESLRYYITSIIGLFAFLAVLILEPSLFFRALLFSLYTALGISLSAVALLSTSALVPYDVLFFPTFCIV